MKYHIKYCDKCQLGIFNGFVPVSGQGAGTDIMIIGEAPGGTEVKKGEPFVGKAGKLLRKMLTSRDLLQYCYLTNAIKCRPPSNRTPRLNECKSCHPFLIKEIIAFKPKLVILLGLTAIQSFYPYEQYVKNKAYRYNVLGKMIVACAYHPSYLERNKDKILEYEQFFNEIAILYNYLNPYYTIPVK